MYKIIQIADINVNVGITKMKAGKIIHLLDKETDGGWWYEIAICEKHLQNNIANTGFEITFDIDRVNCDLCLRLYKLKIFI